MAVVVAILRCVGVSITREVGWKGKSALRPFLLSKYFKHANKAVWTQLLIL